MNILPYVKYEDGSWSIPEESIKSLFHRMEAEKKTRIVFYNNSITSENDFLDFIQDRNNMAYIIVCDSGVCGFAWLNNFDEKTARIHFCSFNGFKRKELLAAGEFTIKTILGFKNKYGENMLDALTGIIMARNKAAWSFLADLGFTKIGIHPCGAFVSDTGKSEDSVIFYITRFQAESL